MQRSFISWMPGALLLAVLSATTVYAQEPERAPDGGTTYRVTGVELLAIPNKPFFADTRTDWTRVLEDGSIVKVYLEARLARDSQGKVYRERRTFVPEGSTAKSRLKEILLFDPQARTRTTCTLATRHCSITSYLPRTTFVTQPVGPFDRGTRSLAREPLGMQVIENLSVSGTRETTTTNPGVMGNEQPLATTREFWYSPDIQTNLLTTRKDPREGTQIIRLSAVSRGEPDASLFQVPEGFTVQDDRVAGAPLPSTR
jgi:hypothetical protein